MSLSKQTSDACSDVLCMNGVIVTFLQTSHTSDGDPESHVPGVGDNSRPNPDAES